MIRYLNQESIVEGISVKKWNISSTSFMMIVDIPLH